MAVKNCTTENALRQSYQSWRITVAGRQHLVARGCCPQVSLVFSLTNIMLVMVLGALPAGRRMQIQELSSG